MTAPMRRTFGLTTTTPPTTTPRTPVQDESGAPTVAPIAPNRGVGLLLLRGFPPLLIVTMASGGLTSIVIIIVMTADQDQEEALAIDLPILSSLQRCCPPSPPRSPPRFGRAYTNRTSCSSRVRRPPRQRPIRSKAVSRKPLAICPVGRMWPGTSWRHWTRPREAFRRC